MTGVLAAEYAELDGHRIYYERSGNKSPAVVLVHGWTCDTSFWRAQVPALSKEFTVVALDLPGHGKSDRPAVTYDLKLFARSVDAVMRAAGIKRAVLAGHSMGASVIRQVLNDYPERVAGLISIDGSVFRIQSRQSAEDFKKWSATMSGPSGPQARRKFIEGMFVDATPQALREDILRRMLSTPAEVAVSAINHSVLSEVWSGAKVNVPVLAINKRAKNDGIRAFHQEVFANLEYHEIDGAGHFLHMEKPEEVNRLMAEFVKKVAR